MRISSAAYFTKLNEENGRYCRIGRLEVGFRPRRHPHSSRRCSGLLFHPRLSGHRYILNREGKRLGYPQVEISVFRYRRKNGKIPMEIRQICIVGLENLPIPNQYCCPVPLVSLFNFQVSNKLTPISLVRDCMPTLRHFLLLTDNH